MTDPIIHIRTPNGDIPLPPREKEIEFHGVAVPTFLRFQRMVKRNVRRSLRRCRRLGIAAPADVRAMKRLMMRGGKP